MARPRIGRQAPQGPWSALARALYLRRIALELTQRDAADLAGLSERALRDIESGGVAPRLDALTSLAEALGLRLALFPRSDATTLPEGTVEIRRGDGVSGE